jgi:hypothetical protein
MFNIRRSAVWPLASWFSFGVVLAGAGEPSSRQGVNCPREPVAACTTRHGRYSTQNGTAQIIWLIGTNRVVGVANDAEHFLPSSVLKYTEISSENHSYIFGDFTICPTERDRPGYMRNVCVADIKNLVVELLNRSRPPFRVRSTWSQHAQGNLRNRAR